MSTAVAAPALSPTVPHPLKSLDFRLVWMGTAISLFGDQFYFVALPWLVLQLTGSGLALGTILMLAAIPRAVFMLFGGVATDRISSRKILMSTAGSRMVLVAITAALVYFRLIHLWHLYFLAFTFGIADAFALPAAQALIPTLVVPQQLPRANGLLASTSQFSSIAGPVPAGFILKVWGVAAAFIIDAISFMFVIAALFRLKDVRPPQQTARGNLWSQVGEGIQYIVKDPPMRSFMLLVAASNFAVAGPLGVGLAMLAKQRFASPSLFGILMSSLAVGTLCGVLTATFAKFQFRRGALILTFSTSLGMAMIAIGLLHSSVAIAAVLAFLGFGNGLTGVYIQSWFQLKIRPDLMGRVMSVFMLAVFGLAPFSYAAAGFMAQASLAIMFVAAGCFVLLLTLIASLNEEVRATA
jgi:Transmembrane secretion effector